MIGEVIKRRYYRLLEENSELPDLILIDGGKGQLECCSEIFRISWIEITLCFFSKRK